jgi:hypothetical protein
MQGHRDTEGTDSVMWRWRLETWLPGEKSQQLPGLGDSPETGSPSAPGEPALPTGLTLNFELLAS